MQLRGSVKQKPKKSIENFEDPCGYFPDLIPGIVPIGLDKG